LRRYTGDSTGSGFIPKAENSGIRRLPRLRQKESLSNY
jgi:hypothetical protein